MIFRQFSYENFYHLDCFFPFWVMNGTFITSWYFNPITFYSTVVKFIVSLSNHLTSTGMFLIANFLIAMSRLWFYNQKWLSFRLTFFTFLLGLPEIDVKVQLHFSLLFAIPPKKGHQLHIPWHKYVSMTTLLTHTVAHSTKPSFRPKTNNQTLKKFLSLALSWTKVVKNWTSF